MQKLGLDGPRLGLNQLPLKKQISTPWSTDPLDELGVRIVDVSVLVFAHDKVFVKAEAVDAQLVEAVQVRVCGLALVMEQHDEAKGSPGLVEGL